MFSKKLSVLGLIGVWLLLLLTGCGKGGSDNTVQKFASLTIAGSTSVQPLMEELAKSYQEKNSNVRIMVQGGGSSAGIKSVAAGSADLGMSSRELKDSEKNGLEPLEIAKDGIAVIVNSTNGVKELTLQQVADIFSGKITNWKDVGGADKKIVVVTREEGSGTRGAFEEIVMKDEKIMTSAITQNTTGSVHQTVAQDESSIGYISIGNLDDKVKAVAIDNVEANEDNVKQGTYKISRPFLVISKGEPSPEAKAFLEWILGDEGQSIVAKKFISVK